MSTLSIDYSKLHSFHKVKYRCLKYKTNNSNNNWLLISIKPHFFERKTLQVIHSQSGHFANEIGI